VPGANGCFDCPQFTFGPGASPCLSCGSSSQRNLKYCKATSFSYPSTYPAPIGANGLVLYLEGNGVASVNVTSGAFFRYQPGGEVSIAADFSSNTGLVLNSAGLYRVSLSPFSTLASNTSIIPARTLTSLFPAGAVFDATSGLAFYFVTNGTFVHVLSYRVSDLAFAGRLVITADVLGTNVTAVSGIVQAWADQTSRKAYFACTGSPVLVVELDLAMAAATSLSAASVRAAILPSSDGSAVALFADAGYVYVGTERTVVRLSQSTLLRVDATLLRAPSGEWDGAIQAIVPAPNGTETLLAVTCYTYNPSSASASGNVVYMRQGPTLDRLGGFRFPPNYSNAKSVATVFTDPTNVYNAFPSAPSFYVMIANNIWARVPVALCPPGEASDASEVCVTCGPGSFTNHTGALSCYSCSAGSISATARSTSCSICPAGTSAASGSSSCSNCTAGWFSGPGSGVCSRCGPSSFAVAPGSASCSTCPPGTAHSVSAATSAAACRTCSAGFFSVSGGQCTLCPPNTFSSAGAGACSPCPFGTTNFAFGSTQCFGPATAELLPAANASAAGSPSSAFIHGATGITYTVYPAAGAIYAYTPAGTLAGTYSTDLGTPRSITVSSTGTVYVTDSAGGRLLALNTSTFSVASVVIPSGLVASASNGAGTPDIVPGPLPGSVLVIDAGGSASGARIQLVTGAGVVTVLADSSNSGSAALGSSPTSAAVDPSTGLLYVGTSSAVVLVNATGDAVSWYTHGVGGASVLDVAFVPASATQDGGAQVWVTLSTGDIMVVDVSAGTLVRTITPPAGVGAVGTSVNPNTGEALVFSSVNSSVVRGVLCTAGSFFMQPCAVCSPGSAPNATGACVQCAPGSFASTSGAPACSLCPTGTAAASTGATSCSNCGSGLYAPSTGMTACIQTPAGTYAAQASGSSSAIPCPAGTFRSAPGGASIGACALCPPGTVNSGTGARTCNACPSGTASSAFNSSTCTLCGMTFGPLTGGASMCYTSAASGAVPAFSFFSAVDPGSQYIATYTTGGSRMVGLVHWGTWAAASATVWANPNAEPSAFAFDGTFAYAYISSVVPPVLAVYRMLPSSQAVRRLAFPLSFGAVSTMLVDSATGYLYVFSSTSASLALVNATDGGAAFNASLPGYIVAAPGNAPISAGRVVAAGGVAYLATAEVPARLISVQLSSLTVLQSISGLPASLAVNITNVYVSSSSPGVALLQADTRPNSTVIKVDLAGSGSVSGSVTLPTSRAPVVSGVNLFSSDGAIAYIGTGPYFPVSTPFTAHDAFIYALNVSSLAVVSTWRPTAQDRIDTRTDVIGSFAVDASRGAALSLFSKATSNVGTGRNMGISFASSPALGGSALGSPVPNTYIFDPVTPSILYMPIADGPASTTTYSFNVMRVGAGGSLTVIASLPFPANVGRVYMCVLYDSNQAIACGVEYRSSRNGDIALLNISAAAVSANGGVPAPPTVANFNVADGPLRALAVNPLNPLQIYASYVTGWRIFNPLAGTSSAGPFMPPSQQYDMSQTHTYQSPVWAATYGSYVYFAGSTNSGYRLHQIDPSNNTVRGTIASPASMAYYAFVPILDAVAGYIYVASFTFQTIRVGDGIPFESVFMSTAGSMGPVMYGPTLAVVPTVYRSGSSAMVIFATAHSQLFQPQSTLIYVSVSNPASPVLLGTSLINLPTDPAFPLTSSIPGSWQLFSAQTLIADPVTPTNVISVTGAPGAGVVPFVFSMPSTVCGPGSIWDPVGLSCVLCAGGTFSSNGVGTVCMSCSPGLFSAPGSSACSSCPAGTFAAR
jgi:hypothetical protein